MLRIKLISAALTASGLAAAHVGGMLPFRTDDAVLRKRSLKIEFIGDSYSVGYGNTSLSIECSPEEARKRTDTSRAFGSIAAKNLGADYRVFAISGLGMVRNTDGTKPDENMPDRYFATKTASPGWHPDWFVIFLGINDFSTPVAAGEKWTNLNELTTDYRQRYVRFVNELHSRHPRARFLLVSSWSFKEPLRQVEGDLVAAKVPVVIVDAPPMAGTACQNHPNLEDHAALGAVVAAALDRR